MTSKLTDVSGSSMANARIEEIKRAAMPLIKYWEKECNMHESIVIDEYGIRILSAKIGIPERFLACAEARKEV